MKKFIIIVALFAGMIGTTNVFAQQSTTQQCKTTEEVKQDTDAVEECYVHPADGVVSCKE